MMQELDPRDSKKKIIGRWYWKIFISQNKKCFSHMVIQKKKVSKWKDIEVQDIDMRIWMNTDMARE